MIELRLTYIPETDMMCLSDDKNMTPLVIETKTIIHEHAIKDLPEVKALRKHDVVIDVGAFVGDTALIFAQYSENVFAFEPQVDAFVCASWNTRRCKGVAVINAAIGDGELASASQDCFEPNGNLATRGINLGGECRAARIDEMNLERLDFLKIDCEGFEPSVIRGGLNTIAKFRPVILCELYDSMLDRYGFTRSDVIGPLTKMGYSYRCAIGDEAHERCDLLFSLPKG
jgi:FkbM family methyltransferase